MAKYKVEYDPNTCIGTRQCMWEAKEVFKEDANGFTVMENGTLNEATGKYEIIVDEAFFEQAKAAENSCQVQAIKVSKIE